MVKGISGNGSCLRPRKFPWSQNLGERLFPREADETRLAPLVGDPPSQLAMGSDRCCWSFQAVAASSGAVGGALSFRLSDRERKAHGNRFREAREAMGKDRLDALDMSDVFGGSRAAS
jgi:hypothetical protein